MPLEKPDQNTVALDELPAPPPAHPISPQPAASFDTTIKLVPGMLSFLGPDKKLHSCLFQFNPTELERTRTIKVTRSPTGNTREEPREGPRNQAKRKFTAKPEPWLINLTLRYDASYHQDASHHQDAMTENDTSAQRSATSGVGSFKHRIQRIDKALEFFESLSEPGPFVSENEKAGNADETPQPPKIDLTYGHRQWKCLLSSIRLKELEYTPDLYPRRFEVTLALEAMETVRNGIDHQTGAKR